MMDELVIILEKKLLNQQTKETFRMIIMEHAKYLSCHIANMEEALDSRMHPLIIAISRVHE